MGRNPSSRQPAAVRIQSRLSIDPDMGEIYDWLIGLSPVVRGRELLHAARLGHAVLRGQALLAAPALGIPAPPGAHAASPEIGRQEQTELALSEPPEPIDIVRQAEQADLQVLAGWSLEGMLPPAARSQLVFRHRPSPTFQQVATTGFFSFWGC